MTIQEAIARIDSLKPNNYLQDEKIRWLSELDGIVYKEIIDTHEDKTINEFNGYNSETSVDTELLIPFPHNDIYIKWLESRIDYTNGEYGKFNNSITMFNSAYMQYSNFYNKHHLPKANAENKYF